MLENGNLSIVLMGSVGHEFGLGRVGVVCFYSTVSGASMGMTDSGGWNHLEGSLSTHRESDLGSSGIP